MIAITRISSRRVKAVAVRRRATGVLLGVDVPVVELIAAGVLTALRGVEVEALRIVLAGVLVDVRRAPGVLRRVLDVGAVPVVVHVARRRQQRGQSFVAG